MFSICIYIIHDCLDNSKAFLIVHRKLTVCSERIELSAPSKNQHLLTWNALFLGVFPKGADLPGVLIILQFITPVLSALHYTHAGRHQTLCQRWRGIPFEGNRNSGSDFSKPPLPDVTILLLARRLFSFAVVRQITIMIQFIFGYSGNTFRFMLI